MEAPSSSCPRFAKFDRIGYTGQGPRLRHVRQEARPGNVLKRLPGFVKLTRNSADEEVPTSTKGSLSLTQMIQFSWRKRLVVRCSYSKLVIYCAKFFFRSFNLVKIAKIFFPVKQSFFTAKNEAIRRTEKSIYFIFLTKTNIREENRFNLRRNSHMRRNQIKSFLSFFRFRLCVKKKSYSSIESSID